MKQIYTRYALMAFIVLITVVCSSDLFAQNRNMVLNYSFEEYSECPDDYTPQDMSHKLVTDWTYPTLSTPDYFNRCSPRNVGVPRNFAGESEPLTGDGYAGAILSGTEESYREYIQGQLSGPMIEGRQYCVRFSYKLASYSRFAVDQMSLYFSEVAIRNNDININLSYTPQITNQAGLFLDNIEEWQEICTVYTARGDEEFFIIGNFRNYDNTNYVVTDKNVVNLRNKAYAYYYFDDIVISPLDNCISCPCVQHDFESRVIESRYTGGKEPVSGKTERIINDGQIRLGLIGGTPPYTVSWNNNMTGTMLDNLPAGRYIYTARDAFNCLSSDTIVFIEPEIEMGDADDGFRNIEEGSSIILENIFFEYDKTELLPESYPELDKVVEFMLEENIELIEISGHTDSDGADPYNQKLSEGRAKAVVDYLALQGVGTDHMQSVGYGETRPIDTNHNDYGKASNRRVEFLLIKK